MFDDSIKNQNDFKDNRLVFDNGSSITVGWIQDLITSIATVYALKKSIKTIHKQYEKKNVLYKKNGMRDSKSLHLRLMSMGGHWEAEKRVDIDLNQNFTRIKNAATYSCEVKNIHPSCFKMDASMEYFSEMIDFCMEYDIDLLMFISPEHSRYLERIRKYELWNEYEQWKKMLVKTLAGKSALKSSFHCKLWDFSGYNSITTDDFPSIKCPEQNMKWYWESSHYKKEVGDMILDRVLGWESSSENFPDDFGVVLTENNIQNNLQKIRRERSKYIKEHWIDIKDIWANDLKLAKSSCLK